MGGEGNMTTCVARRTERARFQPFIEAHVRRLPGRVEVLCGRQLDVDGMGRPVGPPRLVRALGGAVRRVSRVRLDRWFVSGAQAGFFRRRGVDVVLAEGGPVGVLIQQACRRAGVPLVAHFHGYEAYVDRAIEVWGEAYRRMFRACAAVVAVSHAMQEQLIRLGAPAEKLRYHPSGVDLEQFSRTDPASNPPLFVAVGRFVEKKAPDLTLLAFRRVLDACPEGRLLMIGDGALLDTCRHMVEGMGMSHAVELPGRLPHERIPEAMARARAFVQHSVRAANGDSEGTPVAILEAGACGLPVVSTRHAGIPEAVVDGETGLLVDERDVEGMADRMIALAGDPALARSLGEAARRRVAVEFSMEKSIGGLWRTLLEAAERK